jgi:hypothetical protein
MKPKKKKTYIVPVIHHVSFGCEVLVEAASAEEARALVNGPVGARSPIMGDCYDWDRMHLDFVTSAPGSRARRFWP